MKAEIIQDPAEEIVRVEIHCSDVTREVSKLKCYIENYRTGLIGTENGTKLMVGLSEILYIESVDKKTFIYTDNSVLNTDKRLYELEELLDKSDFFRCSKSVIININKVVKLKPEITRNILATLTNGEVVVISRRYATELKKLIGV